MSTSSSDDLYDDCIDIVRRKMKGDPNVKDSEYFTARDMLNSVFMMIHSERKDLEFPEQVDDGKD